MADFMKERRAKNKIKSFLVKYCKDNGLKAKDLAKRIGLENAKEMFDRCVWYEWSPEEISIISNITGEPLSSIEKMAARPKKTKRVKLMRLFIKDYCNKNNISGRQFAEDLLGISYNGLFLKINNYRWTTTELQKISKITGQTFENLALLSVNEPIDDGN